MTERTNWPELERFQKLSPSTDPLYAEKIELVRNRALRLIDAIRNVCPFESHEARDAVVLARRAAIVAEAGILDLDRELMAEAAAATPTD